MVATFWNVRLLSILSRAGPGRKMMWPLLIFEAVNSFSVRVESLLIPTRKLPKSPSLTMLPFWRADFIAKMQPSITAMTSPLVTVLLSDMVSQMLLKSIVLVALALAKYFLTPFPDKS